jgi:23S rRNA pseudouridine1911/1915/1917 synthase
VKAVSLTVTRPELTLARVVREAFGNTEVSWNKARELCHSGRVEIDGRAVLDAELRVPVGATVSVDPTAPRLRKGVLPEAAFIYVDSDVVVVNKPVGVMTCPFEPGDRDTLVDLARAGLRRRGPRGFDPELGIVHRIDVDTTGLVVFTRNLAAKRHLSSQFRAHTTHRRYVALAHGSVIGRTFDSVILRDRGDGLRGSLGHFRPARGRTPADGQHAVTHVRVLERFAQACLVECMLETGRQHQIRIHLSEAGHPLLGERVYIRDFRGPRVEALRPMLHARELGFVHPKTGRAMRFTQDPPEDFAAALANLRGR